MHVTAWTACYEARDYQNEIIFKRSYVATFEYPSCHMVSLDV